MQILDRKPNRNARRYQVGGPMEEAPMEEAPAGAPAEGAAPEGGEQDPLMQILQVAAQAVQTQNCEAAMAVCQALLQIAQGGGAPAEEPTFARRGTKLTRVR